MAPKKDPFAACKKKAPPARVSKASKAIGKTNTVSSCCKPKPKAPPTRGTKAKPSKTNAKKDGPKNKPVPASKKKIPPARVSQASKAIGKKEIPKGYKKCPQCKGTGRVKDKPSSYKGGSGRKGGIFSAFYKHVTERVKQKKLHIGKPWTSVMERAGYCWNCLTEAQKQEFSQKVNIPYKGKGSNGQQCQAPSGASGCDFPPPPSSSSPPSNAWGNGSSRNWDNQNHAPFDDVVVFKRRGSNADSNPLPPQAPASNDYDADWNGSRERYDTKYTPGPPFPWA